MRSLIVLFLLLWMAPLPALALVAAPVPPHGVIGVDPRHLAADWWIGRHPQPDAVRLSGDAIAALNAALVQDDASVHALEELPDSVARDAVIGWLEKVSNEPSAPLFDEQGKQLDAQRIEALLASTAKDRIPDEVGIRFGMVTSRADMRSFPTAGRVFRTPDDRDIDRFQETALFPGTPLALLHQSRDRQWWFAISPLYAAWIPAGNVAVGSRAEVLGYASKTPFLVVTGASAETVYTPEQPGLSKLRLDMGVRVPLLADWPADTLVNGQHPYAAHVIELPVRDEDGSLRFAPALLPLTADVSLGYPKLTTAALLRQAYKFLGERYGWGHSYAGRDCSGFVSEVYRSFGVVLPRNTSDQAVTPVLERIAFTADDSIEERTAVLRTLEPGALIYIPGHVMMVVGHDAAGPYVIHDVTGIGYRTEEGSIRRVPLNQVAVTPLLPLRLGDGRSYVERITSIQRLPSGAAR